MCIIIDADSLSCVFSEDNAQHEDFKPILDWILNGKGKIVYGGTTYEKELSKAHRYLKIIAELDKINKTVIIDKIAVDIKEDEFDRMIKHRDFDDPHIMAIVEVSGVKLICTHERRSIQFLKDRRYYSRGRRPKVYTSKKNANLLCDSNIAECCKPIKLLKKAR